MKRLIYLFLFTIIIASCTQNKFEVIDNLSNLKYQLVDQNGSKFIFPKDNFGKYSLVGYIFTNCPDICPITTNNMRLVQERLKKEGLNKNINLTLISFDPLVDTPNRLKKYAELRGLDLSNWKFLTGQKETVDSLMHHIGIMAIPSDSTITSDGKKIFYYVHTDRISLFDKEGKIIKNYQGSKANIEEIVNDIKELED